MALVMVQANPLSPLPNVVRLDGNAIPFDGDASFSKSEQQLVNKLKHLSLLDNNGVVPAVPRYSSLSSSPLSRRRKRAEEEQRNSISSSEQEQQSEEPREQEASQSQATPATTTTTSNVLKVSFPAGKDIVSSTHYTLRLDEFTDDELLSYWYSSTEFQSLRKERKLLVKGFEKNSGVLPEGNEDDCFRGLESKTRSGNAKRQFNIMDAMNAVLDEQDRHDDMGCGSSSSHHKRGTAFDPVIQIASLYRRYTQACQIAAEKLGHEDEMWVNENVRNELELK